MVLLIIVCVWQGNTRFKVLHLRDNLLGDEGVAYLAEVLQVCF